MSRRIAQLALLVRDYEHLRTSGVRFTEQPRDEPYGRVVVFLDLYGNKWDLIARCTATSAQA